MASTFETFVAFGTDIIGLERFLRFWQAFLMVLTARPSVLAALLPLSPSFALMRDGTSLLQAQKHLNVARRWMRLFRFLSSLQISWTLYASDTDKNIETWLEIGSKTALGMYGLLESITLPDLSGVDGLDFFGPQTTKDLNRQAQIFWFLALYLSVLVSGIKLIRLFAYRPVPQTGSGYGTGDEPGGPSPKTQDEKPAVDRDEELKRDREKLRSVVRRRKEASRAWLREVRGKAQTLGLRLLSDLLDLVIPVRAVGWLDVDLALVGLAMMATSVLTSKDVWARCSVEVDSRRGKAN